MKYESEISQDLPDEELWLCCNNCGCETYHKTRASVNLNGHHPPSGIEWSTSYQIIECQGCKTPSFRKCHVNHEALHLVSTGELSEEQAEYEELFPSRLIGRPVLKDSYLLPNQIEHIYQETRKALLNKQPILAAIGIRALLEAICKQKSVAGRSLKHQIDGLADEGLLSRESLTILHSLRIMGNESAHEISIHTEEKLGIAMDVVEHLLEGVYILPYHFGKLEQRK